MAGENGLDDTYFSDVTDTAPEKTIEAGTAVVDATKVEDKQVTAPNVVDDKSKQVDDKSKPVDKSKPPQQQDKPDDKSQQQQPPKIKKGSRGDFMDDKGNITDDKGNVLYPAGRARRAYEDNVRLREERAELIPRLQTAELQLREINYLNGVPQRFQLNNEEVATALDWAARMKREPLSVAKDLLAMITAQGYNVTDLLGKDVGDSIDMRGIKALLDQRLAPIEQQRNETREEDARLQDARRQYNQFLNDNEFASVHENEIAALAKREQINPQQAYNQLYRFAADNSLDFSMPLGPQIVAKREAAGQQQQPNGQQQQQPNAQRPLPSNGAQTRVDGAKPQTPVMADPDDDWATIINRAMQTS